MFNFSFEHGINVPTIKANIIKDDVLIGYFLMVPHSEQMYEIHTSNIIPSQRGHTYEAGLLGMHYAFENMDKLEKLITKVPVHNRLAAILAKKCGMKLEGLIKNSFLYEDQLEDQEIYGICRGEI